MKNTTVRRMMVRAVSMMMLGGMLSGCLTEEDELQLNDVATSKQAVTTPNPAFDADYIYSFNDANAYRDIAVSSSQFYLQKNNGYTEVRNISSPASVVFSSPTNFTALDYVNSTWGLIAARDSSQTFYLNAFGGSNAIAIAYPDGDYELTSVGEIAARSISSTEIQVFLKGSVYPHTSSSLVYGTYTVNDGMDWDRKVSAQFEYGLFTREFSGTDYLMYYKGYYTNRIMRRVAPNGTTTSEDLGSNDSHAYYVPDLIFGWDSISNPYGMDYANGKYYVLEYCAGNNHTRTCIASIDDDEVNF